MYKPFQVFMGALITLRPGSYHQTLSAAKVYGAVNAKYGTLPI